MVKFGTPLEACKLKMRAEGLDPSVLDMDPDGPSPNAASAAPPPPSAPPPPPPGAPPAVLALKDDPHFSK